MITWAIAPGYRAYSECIVLRFAAERKVSMTIRATQMPDSANRTKGFEATMAAFVTSLVSRKKFQEGPNKNNLKIRRLSPIS
jgi:hypothetical protein